MTRVRNIWDAVWGQIELTEEEWELVNTPVFQRLRRIHQLAMTMLVFPGATHTRFEHSLGTLHVADRIARRLIDLHGQGESARFDEADRRIVRLAALLHDIGHGPFSHVADPLLGKKGHERIGAQALLHVPSLRDLVDSSRAGTSTAIADILLGSGPRSIARDIVSGPADADKLDYLMRDSHYTGVRGGHFDHEYLIDQLVGIESVGESWLGFRWNGVWAVEGLKLARYHMHRTVYGHRNRVVTDHMLRRALEGAVADWLPSDLFSIPGDPAAFEAWFQQYLAFDDWRITTEGATAVGPSGDMFRRLRDHRLLKVLVFLEGEDLRRKLGSEHARLLAARSDHFEAAIEPALAEHLGQPPEQVIAYLLNPSHVLDYDPLRLDDDINFRNEAGDFAPFSERSEVFSAVPAERWRRQLVVYSPVGRRDDPVLAHVAEEQTLELLRATVAEGR